MGTRDEDRGRARQDTTERRPYAKPEIVARETIEAMAGVCPAPDGKTAGVCSIPNT